MYVEIWRNGFIKEPPSLQIMTFSSTIKIKGLTRLKRYKTGNIENSCPFK